jgi:FkbM family methyltransferase
MRAAHLMFKVVPSYFELFGPARGVATLVRQLRHRLQKKPLPFFVTLPGLREPVALRPHSSDRGILHQVFVQRDHDLKLTLEPRFIVDAGANAGYASVFFANRYPEAKIVALEVARCNFDILKINIAPYPNIIAVHAGLWGRVAHLSIENPNDEQSAFRVREAPKGADTIPALTVSNLLERFGEYQIDLLKIDIEGAESEVFGGQAASWLPKVRTLMIELHEWLRPGCTDRVLTACAGLGFVASWSGEYLVLSRPDLLQVSQDSNLQRAVASR